MLLTENNYQSKRRKRDGLKSEEIYEKSQPHLKEKQIALFDDLTTK